MDDLRKAVSGKEILLELYEPIDGFSVAIINDNDVPIELIQTNLTPDVMRKSTDATKFEYG